MDFREIEYEEINENTVKIKLPKAKIYKYYQVPNTFKDYLDDESWFTNINSKERHDLEDAVVEKGKEKALEAGLLEKADKNAKTIINFLVIFLFVKNFILRVPLSSHWLVYLSLFQQIQILLL